MAEIGIDISQNKTKSIFPFMRERPVFNFAISICDKSSHEHRLTFPAGVRYLQWSFPAPSTMGTYEERLAGIRYLRDTMKARVEAWCAGMCVAEGES